MSDSELNEVVLPPPPPTTPSTSVCHPRQSKWERQWLPSCLVISSRLSNTLSLCIPVQLETTDTSIMRALRALIDCGATGLFINSCYVETHRLTTWTLARPIEVYNIDGTHNEAGSITSVVDAVLRYKDHTEQAIFCVTRLGNQDMILGYPWLRDHNPQINWETQEVTMDRCVCSGCSTCLAQVKRKCSDCQASLQAMHICAAGDMPVLCEEDVPLPELIPNIDADEEPEEPLLLEGDQLFCAYIPPPLVQVCATTTTSQQLAEAFHKNDIPKRFEDLVPPDLHDFADVFSKESFDTLSNPKSWDHAIELHPALKCSQQSAMLHQSRLLQRRCNQSRHILCCNSK